MDDRDEWITTHVLERFLRYVRIDTMSDPDQSARPTSKGQLELGGLLVAELQQLGVRDIYRDEKGFIIAAVPAQDSQNKNVIGFLAHLDTSSEVTGKGVNPQIHEHYDGKPINLNNSITLDPATAPELLKYTGATLVTTDGNTLLGADDKAGIAAIMTALEYLLQHKEIGRPGMEIIYTTDEETGRGMEGFPVTRLQSVFCYTVDGGEENTIEAENFDAYKVIVHCTGRSFHLGKARGRLINAIQLAMHLISLLPAGEKPETTENREGYYCPIKIQGTIESAAVEFLIRDFSTAECLRRIAVIKQIAGAIEAAYPGSRITLESEKQYANMQPYLGKNVPGLTLLEEAIRMTGSEPVYAIIRGGTDGARLSELGIPTPNIFTGGFNFHSRYEWIPLPALARAANTVINLAQLWAAL